MNILKSNEILISPVLKSSAKSDGYIWGNPDGTLYLKPILRGTQVEVYSYQNGYWKIRTGDVTGYLDNNTIYITFPMARYIKK